MAARSPLSTIVVCGAIAAVTAALAGCGALSTGADEDVPTPDEASTTAGSDAALQLAPASSLPSSSASGLVVTIGDSIMAGLGLQADEAWPALLAHDTGADIVNLGCSGAGFTITGDCGDDYSGLVQRAIALHPDIVIIQSSDNDAGADESEIDDSTRAAIDELRSALPQARLIGIGTLWHLDWAEPDAIGWSSDALQRAIDADDGVFVSLGQPLRGRPELLQWDGEHPNADGQVVLNDAVEAALDDAGIVL